MPSVSDELDLELPALDGGEDSSEADAAYEPLDAMNDDGDLFDDTTGEDVPYEDLVVEGTESGWLVDAENASSLDVGPLDVAIEPEGKVLGDDEADARAGFDDLVSEEEEDFVSDAGEEGPLHADEELREEDLPALDADEDGDVPDDELYDGTALAMDADLRWDDRAWARVTEPSTLSDDSDDSGLLAVPSESGSQTPRDATWKRLDETGRLMAAAFLPGDSVVVALAVPDRSRALIVRIQTDGEARIIAEVDPQGRSNGEDDGESCVVNFLRWDAARGCLFIGGNFGVEAYRPSA
jgi:hypothetical protein